MKTKLPTLTKKKLMGIVAALLAVVLLIIWFIGSCGKGDAVQASAEYEPYTVERGNITVSVTGSGTVAPIEQYEIQSIVTGDILEDYVTVGTDVSKDQVLYVIDSASAENSIERSVASYEQQLISYNDKVHDYNEAQENRTVEAPVSGVITEMYVENGDEVNAGTKLCEISNTEHLTVRIPFLSTNAKNIHVNQAATIYFDDRNEAISGTVSHVATGTYTTDAGAVVSDVEITFKNPGAILPGETVTATTNGFACNAAGTVEEASVKTVTAEVSGDIADLAYAKGDKVSVGSVILKINDESSSNDLKSSELSLKNARLSLDDQIEKLQDYTIKSPIDGTVISKTMKEGDTLDGNKSSLAIVADMSKLTFEMSVDELYIQNIKVGQTVTVTADALPDKTFEGIVDTVSIIGTATSGVTVYPVTVVIPEYEGLLPGMNVDAEIVISSSEDVLMIPVNAVTRGSLVLTKDDAGMAQSNSTNKPEPQPSGKVPDSDASSQRNESKKARLPDAPEGYKYTVVETGNANDDYVEVISGLSEGDVIYVTVVKNSATTEQTGFGMGGGIPGGGMPAGMPGGGMPGGMSGNRGNMGGGMPDGGMGGMR